MESSATLNMEGRIKNPANKYAKKTEEPVCEAANPGNKKKPEENIAPVLMAYTSISVSFFSNFSPFFAKIARPSTVKR